jgi:NAD dependent epimerase/dehydratase family enzyme
VRNEEFAHTLARVLHRPSFLRTPMLPLRMRYGAELVDTVLLVSQRVVPAALEATGFAFKYPVLEPALEAVLRL